MAITKAKPAGAVHAAGIFADMTLDGPEIGTLVAVIDRARNLPNRKTMGKQDPYCAMRLGKEAKKTETDRRGGQTPKWDQELRFTVHDSPDYYKLKCSVFNEDKKKTDLIGESWIDLKEVIKPGGGQNDLWHQLNYKGKYAGDIRVELTYYDSREKPTEKSRSRDRTPAASEERSNSTSDSVGGPRQLGPRDVRRRPLPTGPAVSSPQQHQDQAPPPTPPKIPIAQPEPLRVYVPAPIRPHEQQQQPSPPAQLQPQSQPQPLRQIQFQDSYNDTYNHERTHHQQYEFEAEISQHQNYSKYTQLPQDYEQQASSPRDPYQFNQYSSMDSAPAPVRACSYPDERELWHSSRSLQSSEPSTPYTLPTASRPSPSSAASDGYIHQYRHQHKPSMSPTKAPVFRDSPLRQSMNHYEVPSAPQLEDEDESVPPPPPPAHRDTPPRRFQDEFVTAPYMPEPLRIAGRSSIHDRSPLQFIEDEFASHRIISAVDSQAIVQHRSHENYRRMSQEPLPTSFQRYERQSSYNSQPAPRDEKQPYVEDYVPDSFDGPYPHFGGSVVEEPQTIPSSRQGQSDQVHQSIESQTNTSRRAISPNTQRMPIRKSVSPSPYSQPDDRRMSSVPFNPDAYDVLNPASSPVTNENTRFETPEQAKESARLREAEQARDMGPIIGNDGRLIDPSDHLPSDTWAPEPEKKTRKPEHVVHIRTRNEARTPSRPGSSPVVIRNSPYHTSPSAVSPHSAPPSSGSRSRVQQQMPVRPLPSQPYPQTQQLSLTSSPAAESPSQRSYDHNPYHDVSPRGPVRPSLSEYQVPSGNSYSPRGNSYHQELPTTPTRGPQYQYGTGLPANHRNSHQGNMYDDPLAAELSMIDIGPSRGGGRTALRSYQGY